MDEGQLQLLKSAIYDQPAPPTAEEHHELTSLLGNLSTQQPPPQPRVSSEAKSCVTQRSPADTGNDGGDVIDHLLAHLRSEAAALSGTQHRPNPAPRAIDVPELSGPGVSELAAALNSLEKPTDGVVTSTSQPSDVFSRRLAAGILQNAQEEHGNPVPRTTVVTSTPPNVTWSADSSPSEYTLRRQSPDSPTKRKSSAEPRGPDEITDPSKIAERDRIREENRERKKRWREVNQDRNKDNDLRCRVNKRATRLFGHTQSEQKTTWMNQEFLKRRSKREQKEKARLEGPHGNGSASVFPTAYRSVYPLYQVTTPQVSGSADLAPDAFINLLQSHRHQPDHIQKMCDWLYRNQNAIPGLLRTLPQALWPPQIRHLAAIQTENGVPCGFSVSATIGVGCDLSEDLGMLIESVEKALPAVTNSRATHEFEVPTNGSTVSQIDVGTSPNDIQLHDDIPAEDIEVMLRAISEQHMDVDQKQPIDLAKSGVSPSTLANLSRLPDDELEVHLENLGLDPDITLNHLVPESTATEDEHHVIEVGEAQGTGVPRDATQALLEQLITGTDMDVDELAKMLKEEEIDILVEQLTSGDGQESSDSPPRLEPDPWIQPQLSAHSVMGRSSPDGLSVPPKRDTSTYCTQETVAAILECLLDNIPQQAHEPHNTTHYRVRQPTQTYNPHSAKRFRGSSVNGPSPSPFNQLQDILHSTNVDMRQGQGLVPSSMPNSHNPTPVDDEELTRRLATLKPPPYKPPLPGSNARVTPPVSTAPPKKKEDEKRIKAMGFPPMLAPPKKT